MNAKPFICMSHVQVLEAACAPGAARVCQLAALAALRGALQSHADFVDSKPKREASGVRERRAAWALACFARAAPPAAATARRLLLGDGINSCSSDAMREDDVQASCSACHIIWRHHRIQPCNPRSVGGVGQPASTLGMHNCACEYCTSKCAVPCACCLSSHPCRDENFDPPEMQYSLQSCHWGGTCPMVRRLWPRR